MNYFLIIGLFLSPFLLKTIKCSTNKPKLWMEPLFFIILVLFAFQIGLCWFPLLKIESYLAYSIISYIFLCAIIFFLLGSFIWFWTKKGWNNWNWRNILTQNISSIICFFLLLIALILLFAFPSLATFSDTNAYISISSNFQNNKYTFNNSETLPYIYLLPTGYYLNGVFSDQNNFYIIYNILWPLLTFYIFYWMINYFVEEMCFKWTIKYKALFAIALTGVYIAVAFIIIFLFTSGNYELQALFVTVSLILVLTKKHNYVVFAFIAFQFFSITAALIGIPIVAAVFIYFFFKGKWVHFLQIIIIALYFALTVISFFFDKRSLALQNIFVIFGTIFLWISLITLFIHSNTYKGVYLHSYVLKKNLNVDFIFKNNLVAKKWAFFGLYVLTFIGMFLVTYFIVLYLVQDLLILLYLSGSLMFVAFGSYELYLLIKHNKQSQIFRWIILFQLTYIAYVLFNQISFGLFEVNTSSWRIMLSSITLGFVSTYVGLIGILLVNIINDNWNYFKQKITKKNKLNLKKLYYVAIGISSSFLGLSTGASVISWVIRLNMVNKVSDNTSIDNNDFMLTLEDKKQLSQINDLVRPNLFSIDEIIYDDRTSNLAIPYSYYSDIYLNLELNNCFPFTYGPTWESGLYNNFILRDAWFKVFQNKQINDLLYVNLNHTIENFNFIVDSAIENINQGGIVNYPNIQLKPTGRNISPWFANNKVNENNNLQPISKDQISVHGAPDFLILNKKTSYFNGLEIIKELTEFKNKNDFIYNLNKQYGYQFLNETENVIYFYNNQLFRNDTIN